MSFINTASNVSVTTASMINTDLNKHHSTNNAMLNQISSASQFESVIRSASLALLEADIRSILDTLESIVVFTEQTENRVEFTGKVTNPKTKKGMVKRYKTTVLKTGGHVVDTQGTIAQRRAFMSSILEEHNVVDIKVVGASKKVINHELVKQAVAQRAEWNRQIQQHKADKVANAAFNAEMSHFVGEIAHIDTQLNILRNATPVRVSKARKTPVIKVKASKARKDSHIKINGKWIAKAAIRNANRMNALTRMRAALTPINRGESCPTPEFGTCLSSIFRTNIVMQQSNINIRREILECFTPTQIAFFNDEEIETIIDDTIEAINIKSASTTEGCFYLTVEEYKELKLEELRAQHFNLDAAIKFHDAVVKAFNDDNAKVCAENGLDVNNIDDYDCTHPHYEWENTATLKDFMLCTLAREGAHVEFESGVVHHFEDALGDPARLYTENWLEMPMKDAIAKLSSTMDTSVCCFENQSDGVDEKTGRYLTISEINTPIKQDLGVQVSKPSAVVTHTEETMTNFARALAHIALMPSKALNPDSDKDARRLAKLNAQIETFVDQFGGKLVPPSYDTLVLMSRPKSRIANAKATGNLLTFMKEFTIYGADSEDNPANVLFAKEEYPARPEVLIGAKYVNDAQAWFGSVIDEATANLDANERAQFVKALFPKHVEFTETEGVFTFNCSGAAGQIVTVDLNAGVLNIGARVLETNPTVDFGDGHEVAGRSALFLLCLSLAGKSYTAINTLVGQVPSMFKIEENYGAKYDHEDLAKAVINNFNLPVGFVKPNSRASKFPFFQLKKARWNTSKLAEFIQRDEIAITDKYNMKWGATGTAAEAVLVGAARDAQGKIVEIFNLNDANKPAKVYNRPASNRYLFAKLADRIKSNFCVALSDGKKAYSAGKLLRAVFSTQRFADGSGVAMINPDFGIDYTVEKSIKETFNVLTLPAAFRPRQKDQRKGYGSFDAATKGALELLNKKASATVGKTFGANEPMVVLTNDATGDSHTVVRNNNVTDVKVTGYSVLQTSDTDVQVRLDVEIIGEFDQYVKLRGIGKKCTTLPYEVSGLGSEWDILLNIEAVKGWPSLVEMFCNAQGGTCLYNSNEATLTLPDGKIVDLKAAENEFTRWCEANTVEQVISFKMNRASYNDHLPVITPYQANSLEELKATTGLGADCFVEDNNDADFVIMHERVQYIKGDLVFDVEVSVPKESVSWSELTLEAANGLAIQDKLFAAQIFKTLERPAKRAKALLASLNRDEKLPVFDITTSAGRVALGNALGNPAKSGKFLNHRLLFETLGKALPHGFTIKITSSQADAKSWSFDVHPQAFNAFGGFSQGSATRELAEVMNFLYLVTDESLDSFKGYDTMIKKQAFRCKTVIDNWALNLIQSKKCMKKITRVGHLLGGKVRTSFDPRLNDVVTDKGEILPVIMMSPAMARRLEKKSYDSKALKDGDIAGITRTPMPFMTAAIVRIESDLPDAHIFVRPAVWHAANEGDSDGDGVSVMNLTQFGFDATRAANMNASLMGPAGYAHVYGENLPFLGFCEYDDKWGKKALNNWGHKFMIKNLTGNKVPKCPVNRINPVAYGAGAKDVSSHYMYNVGASYGVCSVLAFQAADLMHQEVTSAIHKRTRDAVVEAGVIAWRLVYEGLGLSGFSQKATKFFNCLTWAAWDCDGEWIQHKHAPKVARTSSGYISEFIAKKNKLDYVMVDAADELLFILRGDQYIDGQLVKGNDCADLSKDSLIALINARAIYYVYRQIETKGIEGHAKLTSDKSAFSTMVIMNSAVMFGALRRLGQGNDPVEVSVGEEAMVAAQGQPVSLIHEYHANRSVFNAKLHIPALKFVLWHGCELFVKVNTTVAKKAEEAQFSQQ